MIRHVLGRAALLGALAALPPALAAAAPVCTMPADALGASPDLSLAKAHVAHTHRLTVLMLGGAVLTWRTRAGAVASLPARLQVRLSALLPGIGVRVITSAAPHRSAEAVLGTLPADLARSRADLVVWGAGGAEAGAGANPDRLPEVLGRGIAAIHAAGADVVLMDVPYVPALARLIDLDTYRAAVQSAAGVAEVPLLDRYALMQAWQAEGALNLTADAPADRQVLARTLIDCLAGTLARGIADAVR